MMASGSAFKNRLSTLLQKSTCGNCQSENDPNDMRYCITCPAWICPRCVIGHQRTLALKRHQLQDMATGLRGSKTEPARADQKFVVEPGSFDYSHTFKCILIGDIGVGKTCLLRQFTEKKFVADCPSTIDVGLSTRIVEVSGQKIRLQMWDTAGEERFRSITKNYYRGSVGVLLVYDISSRSSYEQLDSWLTEVREEIHRNTVIFLIGNKSDLETQRKVTYEEGKRFADENGLMFRECSAQTGDVEDAFLETAERIYQHIQDGKLDLNATDSGVQLTTQPNSQNESCSC